MIKLFGGWLRSIGWTAIIAGLLIVIVCAALVLIESWRILDARRAQISEAETAAANLARSLAETTNGTFVQADILLAGIVERLEVDGTAPARLERISNLLREARSALPQLQHLSVLDASGSSIASDMSDLDGKVANDREYFRYHQQHDDRAPHMGPPIRSKTSSEWIVTVSRRFNDAPGRFAGVVVASISLSFFSNYFEQFEVGAGGTIVLLGSDGTVINRRPFVESAIGTSMSQSPLYRDHISYDDHGTAWITSRFDGVDRLTAFRKADKYPVYAIVALSKKEIFAPWIDDCIVHGGAMLAFLFVIALVGGWLVRQSVIRHRDQLLLVESRAALVEANAELSDLVREDGLTGIANRREFDRVLGQECSRATRHGSWISLLIIDVDHFKAFNDAHGHVAGDECLRKLGAIVRGSATRPGDLAARYGGEEFVVLLPRTDLPGARRVAEILLETLRTTALPHPASATGFVTASVGVAAMHPGQHGIAAQALVEGADQALYSAKNSGRDCVRVFDPAEPAQFGHLSIGTVGVSATNRDLASAI